MKIIIKIKNINRKNFLTNFRGIKIKDLKLKKKQVAGMLSKIRYYKFICFGKQRLNIVIRI